MAPLNAIETNKEHKITKLSFDKETSHRLSELGLYEGAKIIVLKNDSVNPLILDVRGSRVAIGQKESKLVSVE